MLKNPNRHIRNIPHVQYVMKKLRKYEISITFQQTRYFNAYLTNKRRYYLFLISPFN